MPIYKKKPEEVEAEKYKPGMEDGFAYYGVAGNFIRVATKQEIEEWGAEPRAFQKVPVLIQDDELTRCMTFTQILEGDYIVKPANGIPYPVSDVSFHLQFERVRQLWTD